MQPTTTPPPPPLVASLGTFRPRTSSACLRNCQRPEKLGNPGHSDSVAESRTRLGSFFVASHWLTLRGIGKIRVIR